MKLIARGANFTCLCIEQFLNIVPNAAVSDPDKYVGTGTNKVDSSPAAGALKKLLHTITIACSGT
jgi:hypothetical protein